LSAIRFGGEAGDSMALDNGAYALTKRAGETNGILISQGNTFIERAYFAVTGTDLTKTQTDSAVSAGNYNVVIYDAGYEPAGTGSGAADKETDGMPDQLRFVNHGGSGSLDHVVVNVKESEVTEGLAEFTLGANAVCTFDVPEWAASFMEADGKCVGYYGINGGHKEVVVGFDLRETDFAVKAEFPVFMAGAMGYLSNRSLLAKDAYDAGEALIFNPSAEVAAEDILLYPVPAEEGAQGVQAMAADTSHAGLYRITAGERTEYLTIRAASAGHDGRLTAEDIRNSGSVNAVRAKRSVRNILLVLALLLLVLEWVLYVRKMNYKRKFYLLLRTVLLALVVLALLGLRLPKRSNTVTTVFLVDMSVSDKENIEAFDRYIDDALEDLPRNNRYAIVTFGRNAIVEQFVTDQDMYMGLGAKTDDTATNYEAALQRAAAMLPSDGAGRILVLTDGRQTAGNIENTASLFLSDEIVLESVLIPAVVNEDAYVKSVDMPETLHAGESYFLTVSVESNYETTADVVLTSGGREVARETVRLQKGSNEFVFEETVTADDVESYEVHVEAAGDTCEENNTYSAYARVEDAPKILVLKGEGDGGNAFENVLSAAHVNAEFARPSRAPKNLHDLLGYKAVILENVYMDELPEEFVDNLETYVKDYGGGFVACGGEDSFMLGGYNDSPIETVLPVNMELRGTLQIPSTAIVMVIDHSGSMVTYAGNGLTYLDVAVEAAKRGVDNLRESDQVGILAFDDRYHWSHEISYATDKEAIKDDIETITEGGGTTILPALEEARSALAGCSAQVKHIILLTDGMGETYDFSPVTDKINRDGITLSTVAVGAYSDTKLMEDLAKSCGGRYYFADTDTDIPRIFAQEVYLGGDTYIKNGDYAVYPRISHEITQGLFTQGWYNVLGYIAASPKTGATQLLVSGQDDPILTVWQYGLGKTAAWNTDVDGGWSGAYSGEDNYAELWKRIVDFVAGTPNIGEDYLEVESKDGHTTLTYHTDDYTDGTGISGIYTSPDGGSGEVEFTTSEPGVFTAQIDSMETGLYNLNVRRSDDEEVTGAFTTATVVQYSDEYRFDVTEDKYRGFIDRFGNWIDLDTPVWRPVSSSRSGSFDLSNLFLILTILLFLADIAGRRFGYDPVWKKRKKKVPAAAESGIQQPVEEPVSAQAVVAAETKTKKLKKEKKAKPSDVPDLGTLDTSALLKKKQDRNL
ncbi:MAG: VWA domain-containing protein, partial [Lachnospiraceae bacterium]|nr:VWA domain-containing protein [Lachnospiraceae bacterium]